MMKRNRRTRCKDVPVYASVRMAVDAAPVAMFGRRTAHGLRLATVHCAIHNKMHLLRQLSNPSHEIEALPGYWRPPF